MKMPTRKIFQNRRAAHVAAAALGAVLFAWGAARAADVIVEQPPEPPAPSVSSYLWTGPYIGLHGGYNWLGSELSGQPDIDGIDGLTGGGYLGYNYQFDNNWVAGFEGMAGVSGAENSFGGVNVEQDWEASLRGRIGYAFENSMVYGLAGLAGTRANVSDATGSDSNVHLGWQVGAGLETFLTQNVTGRIEYDYTDYASRGYSLGASSPDVGLNSHSVKVGIGLKF